MTKIRGYKGNLTLSEMQTQIRFEEAGALELVDCIVAVDKENQPINVCKFNELSFGNVPADIVLVEAAAIAPSIVKKILTDTLVIEGQFTLIDFYR
jgi:hypothetical protein